MFETLLPILQGVAPFNASAASQAAITAGSIYTEQTITVVIQLLMVLAVSMQIARGYFLRILRKFTLRLAADIWWLLFILLRDASIFLILFLGVSLFWPGTYQDYPIAVPFMPIAIDLYAAALVILLIKDTDEEPKWNSALTLLVVAGAFLYIIGTVFVTESAVYMATLPPTVSLSASNPWGFFNTFFNSEHNPAMAIYTFYAGFGLFLLLGLIAITASFLQPGGTPRSRIQTNPKPVVKQPAAPEQQQK